MSQATLQLHGSDRVRYFAPVVLCAFLALLCLATGGVSVLLPNMQQAIAITVTALIGVILCAAAGGLLLRLQLRWLRYSHVPIHSSPEAAWHAVHDLVLQAGWKIAQESPGHSLQAVTPGTMFEEGERVAVEFRADEVLIASICDPAVGFTLTGQERCRQHCEQIRQAVLNT